MVKTGLTAAGGLLTAAGAGLMVGVALMETFVVVHVPKTGKCGLDDDTIAQIGVYTSSYDPKCAEGTAVYDAKYGNIDPIESKATLEFPLLFPTQTGYGGVFGEVDKFESCETAWAAGGSLESAALSAGAGGFFGNVDTGLQTNAALSFAKGSLSEFVNGVEGEKPSLTTLFDGVVNGLWKKNVEENVIETFVNASKAVLGFASGTIPNVADGCKADQQQVLAGNFTTVCTENPLSVHTYLLATMSNLVLAGDQLPTEQEPLRDSLILYNSTYALVGAPTAFKGVVGIDYTKALEDQVFLGAKLALQKIAFVEEDAVKKFEANAGFTLLDMCVGATTTKDCKIYEISNAEISENSTKIDNLCTLMYLDAAAASQESRAPIFAGSDSLLTIPRGTPCIYNNATTVLLVDGNIAKLLATAGISSPGISPTELVDIATYIVRKLSSVACSESLTTVGECVGALNTQIEADFSGVPENLVTLDWIPAVLTNNTNPLALFTGVYQEALAAVGVATGAGESDDKIKELTGKAKLAGAPVLVLTLCPTFGKTTRSTCSLALPTILNTVIASQPTSDAAGLKEALVAGAANSLLEGTTREDLIKSCKDDEQDIAVFETAQMMVPAAIGCVSVGMLLSFAAVATKKMPVALVGGLLSVAGGGILMGALLYIQSEAPVYKKLQESASKPPVTGELYYQGGQAQLLALAAVGSSVVGGLVTIGSAFCGNGDEESSALTSKVDNTY